MRSSLYPCSLIGFCKRKTMAAISVVRSGSVSFEVLPTLESFRPMTSWLRQLHSKSAATAMAQAATARSQTPTILRENPIARLYAIKMAGVQSLE